MKPTHLREEDLLSPTARDEAHLRSCDACAARRETQSAVASALRALPRASTVPPAALALLQAKRWAQRSGRRAFAVGFAAALSISVASVVMVSRSRRQVPSELADEIALDHLHYEHRRSAAEVRGDPAAIASYFKAKLGFSPHYGPIEAATFEGGKSCRIGGKWTALAWLERAGHWLSLFAMPEHDLGPRGCAVAHGLRVCAAPDPRGGARVLVGDLSEAELLRLLDESLR